MELEHLRSKIDLLDKQILALLNKRFDIAGEIGKVKRASSVNAYDPEREAALLKKLCNLNPGPIKNETLRAIYREILSGTLSLQTPLSVAFLGPATTFTHQAALAMFGSSVDYVPQPTIPDVFMAVDRGQTDYGTVPVENSTEGAVTHTLDMFVDSTVKICAEINMSIHHNLLGRCRKEELKVLYSHPQVFGQCRRWLQRNLPDIPLVEIASTTEAAAKCAKEPLAGALASKLAATRFELNVLDENFEDFGDNITRFLVLGKRNPERTGNDKTSVLFVLRDRVGALYDSLLPLREHGINLSFIESRPSRRKSWEYYFFVEFLGHVSEPRIKEALDELSENCQFVKILGSYPKAVETA